MTKVLAFLTIKVMNICIKVKLIMPQIHDRREREKKQYRKMFL